MTSSELTSKERAGETHIPLSQAELYIALGTRPSAGCGEKSEE